MNKESNFISAVVYLHSNDSNITRFITTLYKELESHFLNYEIIFVNDCAKKEIIEQIKSFKKNNKSAIVSIINLGHLHGLEAGMRAGIELAIGDYVFEFDSCLLDYEEELILQSYKKCLEGYDIVSTSPKGIKRNITSKLFYHIYNKHSNHNRIIAEERFRVVSRRGINRADAYSKVIPYRKAVYSSIGLSYTTIEYIAEETNLGYKFLNSYKEDMAFDAIAFFTNAGYKIPVYCGCLFVGLFLLLFMLKRYFPDESVLIGGGIILGVLFLSGLISLVIRYLNVIIKLLFNEQKYMIESIEKLSNMDE